MKKLSSIFLLFIFVIGPVFATICNPDPNVPTLIETITMDAGTVLLVDYNMIDNYGAKDGQILKVALKNAPSFVNFSKRQGALGTVIIDPCSVDCGGMQLDPSNSTSYAFRLTITPSRSQYGNYNIYFDANDSCDVAKFYTILVVNKADNRKPFIQEK